MNEEEQLQEDLKRVAKFRREHFEVRLEADHTWHEGYQVLVTHNTSQWAAIDADSLEELQAVADAIISFIKQEKEALAKQAGDIVRKL